MKEVKESQEKELAEVTENLRVARETPVVVVSEEEMQKELAEKVAELEDLMA